MVMGRCTQKEGERGESVEQLCEHGVWKYRCKACWKQGKEAGGICSHGNLKYLCKSCWMLGIKVEGLCKQHGELKSSCSLCTRVEMG